MRKPNTEPRQRRDLPWSITPMYGSRPCTQIQTSTSRGGHTVDLFDEQNRSLASHTRHVHTSTCTKQGDARVGKSIDSRASSSRHRQPVMHTMQILLELVHIKRLSRLTPGTMGALRYLLTFPSP